MTYDVINSRQRRNLAPVLIIGLLPIVTLIGIIGLACILKQGQGLERESLSDELDDEQLTISLK